MKKILLEVEVEGVLRPEQVRDILKEVGKELPAAKYGNSVVVISGRLPVWVFGALVHYLHPFQAVATFDPRLQKGVVVASHTPELRVGDTVGIEDAEKKVVRLVQEAQPVGVKIT